MVGTTTFSIEVLVENGILQNPLRTALCFAGKSHISDSGGDIGKMELLSVPMGVWPANVIDLGI